MDKKHAREIVEALPSLYPTMTADEEEAIWTLLATDKNVGNKISREPLELARAIDGLTEWQKHVQTDSNISRDISVAIEALKAQLGTNLAEVGTDCISRRGAIDALKQQAETMSEWSNRYAEQRKGVLTAVNIVEDLPPAQPEREWSELDKQLIDTLLRKIYELQGTSLSMDGVVAKKYYVNELYKVLFGMGEKPKWMI